jgi:cell division septation protein DedD
MPAIAVVQAVAASSPRQSVHIVPARSVARPTLLMKTATMKIAPTGRFVVQLGAYRSAGRVETAWRKLAASAAYLAPYGPAQSEIRLQVGRVSLYRLALSGFETRADAARICSRIRARGGKCFVRAAAGDHPMTWALKADRSPNRV